MGKRIYIQISTADSIDPESLIAAIQKAHAMLRELDATVSNNPRGHVHWKIETIKKQSPLILGFTGRSRSEEDSIPIIHEQLQVGIKQLTATEEKPKKKTRAKKPAKRVTYSEKFLVALHKFGALQKRDDLGPINVYTTPTSKVAISEKVIRSIECLLGPKYQSVGSVTGSLDSITVHRGHEFRVWDEHSGKPVTCHFPKEMLTQVKDVLKSRVLVYGLIQRNAEGTPISIKVEGIEKLKAESELPTIQEMSGLVDDITDGKTIDEYLEGIRGVL